MEIREGLTFDDVLLSPTYSDIDSRSNIDLSVDICGLHFKHPIIPANMKNVTGLEMAYAVCASGGLPILHRFMDVETQLDYAVELVHQYGGSSFGVSLGVKSEDLHNYSAFMKNGVHVFCIDIAHGDSKLCVEMIKKMRLLSNEATIIAGNVATESGARHLWEAGADIVKVGIGPGSLCTTRIETGNGVPQLTALIDVAKAQAKLLERDKARDVDQRKTYPFISDGGIKSAGDIVKALCFADMVMIGNLFAGSEETPGEVKIVVDGDKALHFKDYEGSSTHKSNHVEGVKAKVLAKGSYRAILGNLVENVQSGLSYQGCHNVTELKDNPVFIKITNAGLRESHPHDVILK